MTRTFLINVLLALTWAAVNGSFSLVTLAFGFLIGAVSLWIIRGQQFNIGVYIGRVWRVTSLIVVFLKDLIVSALKVAAIALSPGRSYQPGFIAFPLTTNRNFEISLLANMITLTPGTLSVDVSDDKSTLFIHCIDVPDPEALKADIAQGFERKIMEALR